jgi:hypothetical protein
MKKLILLTLVICFQIKYGQAQLQIYKESSQKGASATCAVGEIYTGKSIPGKLNKQIASLTLKKGYMATLAQNLEGTGERFSFIAAVSDLEVNLNAKLKNNVSFIRVLPIRNVLKKGGGYIDKKVIDSLNVSWYYNWGPKSESTAISEFVPMAWGKKSAGIENIDTYAAKKEITNFLSFNEPDGKDQSNIPVIDAVEPYSNLLSMGFRMGSPATTEGQATKWLSDFYIATESEKLNIDFIAIHWYDWGGWFQNKDLEPDPERVFKRFKAYIDKIYERYQKPIWITEFNANRNTSEATHLAFMKLALPYLESDVRVERYAYFFPPALLPIKDGKLTPIGNAYQEFKSTPSLKANVTQ